MTTTDLTDPQTRMAARKYVAGAKRRIRDEFGELVLLARSLEGETRDVALDDLAELILELADTLHAPLT